MTPTEQWLFELALVYAVPSFLSGMGVTLLFDHWRDVRRAVTSVPSFLSPKLTFEGPNLVAPGTAPSDKIHSRLPDGLRLR